VEQYYALENAVPVEGKLGTGEASIWAEQLAPSAPDAEVLLRYGKADGWLEDEPAIIARPLGKGRITYVGALLDAALMQKVVAWATADAGVQPEFGALPADVEMCHRVGNGHDVFILIRHGAKGDAAETVILPAPMRDVLHEGALVTKLTLAPEDIVVLSADSQKVQKHDQ